MIRRKVTMVVKDLAELSEVVEERMKEEYHNLLAGDIKNCLEENDMTIESIKIEEIK